MKKALSAFIAASMLALSALLASCGNTPSEPTGTSGTMGSQTSTTESSSASGGETTATSASSENTSASSASGETKPTELTGREKHPDFMDANFGGKTFNFAVSKGWSGGWDNYEIYAEATGNDDLITEAVITRNNVVESLYNCKIRDTKTDNPGDLVNNDIALGTNNYDFLMQLFYGLSPSCMNMANLDINYNNSWWNQKYIDAMSFNYNGTKVIHSVSGKFNLIMYDSIVTLFADMDIYDSAVASGKTDIDLYQTVRDGKWTIDKMLSLMDAAKTDTNGDSEMTFDGGDIFGIVINPNVLAQFGLFYGSGLTTVTKDENGAYIGMSAENTDLTYVSNVINKSSEIYKSPACGQIGERDTVKAVANGQALFNAQWLIRMHSTEKLINYGIDFSEKRLAVVPFPKYDENQEEYGSFVSSRGYGLRVSKSIKDPKAISQFLEVFGYHSEMLLYPEYVKCIKTQCLCDEGAGDMLDIVLDSMVCDYGVWNFNAGINSKIGEMIVSGKNNFSKAIGMASKTCQTNLDKFMKDTYNQMN